MGGICSTHEVTEKYIKDIGKKLFGIPRCVWKDNIKIVLEKRDVSV
jgi:hypothetical protein